MLVVASYFGGGKYEHDHGYRRSEMAHSQKSMPSRRGPVPLPPDEKRTHCVSVRLNGHELTELDIQRGRCQRGEWLRMALFAKMSEMVSVDCAQVWAELAEAKREVLNLRISHTSPSSPGEIGSELDRILRRLDRIQLKVFSTGR